MITLDHDRRQALALIAAGACFGVSAHAEDKLGPERLPEAEFSPEDGATDLAASEDSFRRLTAPVMVNGQGPFPFVVDTGANRSIISQELAAQLGLGPGRPVVVHGITGQRVVPTVRVGQFGVGGRQASNFSMATLREEFLRAPGLLGVDGLKNQRIIFDMPGGRLQIVRSSEPRGSDTGAVIPARRRFGQLTVVDTDLEGARVSVLIDTGSESTVGNSALRRVVQSRPSSGQLQPVSIAGATGEVAVGEFGGIPQFRLGALSIRNLRVAYADLHPFALWDLTKRPALLMGMDIMRFFEKVSLDFGRNEVSFLLPKTPYIDPAGDLRRS